MEKFGPIGKHTSKLHGYVVSTAVPPYDTKPNKTETWGKKYAHKNKPA